MAPEQPESLLIYSETHHTPIFGIASMTVMGLAAAIGGPVFAAVNDDILTGVILVLVVALPSFYAAWTYAKRGGTYCVTFDRRDHSITVEHTHRRTTATTHYQFTDVLNVRVDDSSIHGMPCYGVTLVMRSGEHIPILSSALEHQNAECDDVADEIRAFIHELPGQPAIW